MSEQSTEVKGFKNSVLGKVLFKIASIAGLQEALNGKADVNHSHNVSEITGMDTALKSKIQDGDNLIEVSGDDTDGEIHIKLMSEGDEGEGEDKDFYIGVDKLNDILHPATTPTSGSSKLITSKGVYDALYPSVSITGTYNGGESTTLALSNTGNIPDGIYLTSIAIRRVRNGNNIGTAAIIVRVEAYGSSNISLYYNNALFAHKSGDSWAVDYSGSVLVPVETVPELDTTKYIKITDPDDVLDRYTFYYWYSGIGDSYSVWKANVTAAPAVAVEGANPEVNQKAIEADWTYGNRPDSITVPSDSDYAVSEVHVSES